MTVPALIIASLLALIAFPFFAQMSSGPSTTNRANRSITIHGQKDGGTSSQSKPTQET
jgi:hypothetical protein